MTDHLEAAGLDRPNLLALCLDECGTVREALQLAREVDGFVAGAPNTDLDPRKIEDPVELDLDEERTSDENDDAGDTDAEKPGKPEDETEELPDDAPDPSGESALADVQLCLEELACPEGIKITNAQIADAAGCSVAAVPNLLLQLEADGIIRREGARRGRVIHVLTGDDMDDDIDDEPDAELTGAQDEDQDPEDPDMVLAVTEKRVLEHMISTGGGRAQEYNLDILARQLGTERAVVSRARSQLLKKGYLRQLGSMITGRTYLPIRDADGSPIED